MQRIPTIINEIANPVGTAMGQEQAMRSRGWVPLVAILALALLDVFMGLSFNHVSELARSSQDQTRRMIKAFNDLDGANKKNVQRINTLLEALDQCRGGGRTPASEHVR